MATAGGGGLTVKSNITTPSMTINITTPTTMAAFFILTPPFIIEDITPLPILKQIRLHVKCA